MILIQESKGKRVFDAFFTDKPRNEEPGMLLWKDGNRACYASETSDKAGATEGLIPVIESTLLAGSSIDFHDRGGEFLSLEPQSLGKTVVYSTDNRWTDSELPQGALLSVSGSDWFPESIGIELFPLQQIKVLEPENKILPRERPVIRWESGEVISDGIQVVLTVPYKHTKSDNNEFIRLNRLYCVLPDNGSFELPGSVLSTLGNPDALYVSVTRRRSSELTHRGSVLSVLQISYDR